MAPEVNPNLGIVYILTGETITYDDPRGGSSTLTGPTSVRYWDDPDLGYVVLQPSIGARLRIPRAVFASWPKSL